MDSPTSTCQTACEKQYDDDLYKNVRLQPINCFFECIKVPENASDSLVAVRVKHTTYGISNQLEFTW